MLCERWLYISKENTSFVLFWLGNTKSLRGFNFINLVLVLSVFKFFDAQVIFLKWTKQREKSWVSLVEDLMKRQSGEAVYTTIRTYVVYKGCASSTIMFVMMFTYENYEQCINLVKIINKQLCFGWTMMLW